VTGEHQSGFVKYRRGVKRRRKRIEYIEWEWTRHVPSDYKNFNKISRNSCGSNSFELEGEYSGYAKEDEEIDGKRWMLHVLYMKRTEWC